MTKGRVADVVAERDGLDQVKVEAQSSTDVASHARHQLHVQAAPTQIVVGTEGKDLRLAAHAVVGRHVHDLFGVAHKRGTQGTVLVVRAIAPDGALIRGSKGAERAFCALGRNLTRRLSRKPKGDVWRTGVMELLGHYCLRTTIFCPPYRTVAT